MPSHDQLVVRPARREDLPVLAELQTAAHAADGIERAGSVAWLEHALAHPRGLPTASILLVAERAGLRIGFVESGYFQEPSGLHVLRTRGHVHSMARMQGVGTALLTAATGRLESWATTRALRGPAVLSAWHYQQEVGAEALLSRFGYQLQRRMLEMTRDLKQPVPEPPALPHGVDTRPARQEHLPAIWHAFTASAQEDTGSFLANDAQYRAWCDLPSTQLKRWQIAWAGDQVVALVLSHVESARPQLGSADDVHVTPAWRRRGLGRTLLLESLAQLQRDGCTSALLDVNEENAAARALYKDLGYAPRRVIEVRRKRLDLSGASNP